MAVSYPYSSVPRGVAGTGAAYVLDQNIANAPLATAERMRRRADLLAQHEAARRTKEAQAEAQRLAAIGLTGQPGAYWLDDDMKMVNNHLALDQRVRAGKGTEAELRASQQAIIARRAQSVAASTELDKLFSQMTPANGFTTDARAKAIQKLTFNPDGTKRDPAAAMAEAAKYDVFDTDLMDGAAVTKQFREQQRLGTSEIVTGGGRPGSRVESRTFKDYLPPKVDAATGKALIDPITGTHIPDFDNPETVARMDANRGIRAFVDKYQREMSAASGGPVSRADAAEAYFGDAMRGDVTTQVQYRPFGPQAPRASAAAKTPPATLTPSHGAGSGQFGDTVLGGQNGIAIGDDGKLGFHAPAIAPTVTRYPALRVVLARADNQPNSVNTQLAAGMTMQVLPNGRQKPVKVATTATMRNAVIEFVVAKKDGTVLSGDEVADGDEPGTLTAIKAQIDQAKRAGGVFQMALTGDVTDRDPVVGDGTGETAPTVTTTNDYDETTTKRDPTRSTAVSRVMTPMSQAAAADIKRKSPGYNPYDFTPAQREVLQYAVDAGVPVRGIPPALLPKKRAATAAAKPALPTYGVASAAPTATVATTTGGTRKTRYSKQ